MTDIGLSALLCGGFVGSFFVWPEERRAVWLAINDLDKASLLDSSVKDRDDPFVLVRRLISFLTCTGLSFGFLEFLLRQECSAPTCRSAVLCRLFSPEETLAKSLAVTFGSGIATLTLFFGPLVEGCDIRDIFEIDRLLIFRNFIICPLGEELFFRALLFQILRHRSTASTIFISSVFFALSHSHHIFRFAVSAHRTARESGARASWKRAAETLTGVYAATFIYGLLSGCYYSIVCKYNVPAIALSHSLCNMLGFPRFAFLSEGSAFSRFVCAFAYAGGIAGWAYMIVKLGQR